MQLGPAFSFLATVTNCPEPTAQVIKRFMRQSGWTTKGARGRHAPHVNAQELAAMLIAVMVAEQPAMAVERLPHFAGLPHVGKYRDKTFQDTLARLFERLARIELSDAVDRGFHVQIDLNMSAAAIYISNEAKPEHRFSAIDHLPDDARPIDHLPYLGGVRRSSSIGCYDLIRLAKVILAGEPDPQEAIAEIVFPNLKEVEATA